MRGNQLSPDADVAAYPSTLSLAPGSAANVSTAVLTSKLPELARGTGTSGAEEETHKRPTLGNRLVDHRKTLASTQLLKGKPVLAPPMFVFQKMATPMKRRAEQSEQEPALGVSPSKRVRSFTFPSLHAQVGKAGSRRARSCSISLPPPPPGTPPGRVRTLFFRPAHLLAPQPWSQTTEVSDDPADGPLGVTFDLSSSRGVQMPSLQSLRRNADTAASDRKQFVFGENMRDRVLCPLEPPSGDGLSDSDCSSSDSDSSLSESTRKVTARHTLWESAAAYTASCGRRCVLKRVKLFTGEERESNVVQMTCRLFVLEKVTQSWCERGRGILRLNDLATGTDGNLQSRIVMRHQGSLKVMLNSRLWPHTQLRRPARRSLQVTATDLESQAIRVFLLQASPRDVARLYLALHHRLVALRCGASALGGDTPGRKEGHRNSEEEEEDTVQTEQVNRMRPVVCDWTRVQPRPGSR